MWQIIVRLDRLVGALLRYALVLTLLAMLVILGFAIIMRAVSSMDIGAYQEVIALLFGWMIYLGAVGHTRDGTMFAVELPWGKLGRGVQLMAHLLANLLFLCFSSVMAVWGWRLAFSTIETTGTLGIPMTAMYICLPISGALMVFYTVARLWTVVRPATTFPDQR